MTTAIAGTLTFAGQPFHCVLPWTAVYAAMVEGEQRGTVWPEDVPEDVLTGGGETPAPVPTSTATPPATTSRDAAREAPEPPQARRLTAQSLQRAPPDDRASERGRTPRY